MKPTMGARKDSSVNRRASPRSRRLSSPRSPSADITEHRTPKRSSQPIWHQILIGAGALGVVVVGLVIGVGPSLRTRSVIVLGATPPERAQARARVEVVLGHEYLWSVSLAQVAAALADDPDLRGAIQLKAVTRQWPATVVLELHTIPIASQIQAGFALTDAGEVIPAGSSVNPAPRRVVQICPNDVASSPHCNWLPRAGAWVNPALVAVAGALANEGVSKRTGSAPVGQASVDQVTGLGIIVRLANSATCELGSGERAQAEVRACVEFSTPGAVLDVIDPNSPAVLLNDRVG